MVDVVVVLGAVVGATVVDVVDDVVVDAAVEFDVAGAEAWLDDEHAANASVTNRVVVALRGTAVLLTAGRSYDVAPGAATRLGVPWRMACTDAGRPLCAIQLGERRRPDASSRSCHGSSVRVSPLQATVHIGHGYVCSRNR